MHLTISWFRAAAADEAWSAIVRSGLRSHLRPTVDINLPCRRSNRQGEICS